MPTGSAASSPRGLVLSPFRALRYTARDAAALARLTSPAYDLIGAEDLAALERIDPHNVVRLILPRAEPGDGDGRYRRAAHTLARWRADGVLAADPRPALYVYEMTDGSVSTRGLVGAVGLRPPEAGVILPHEDTMLGPVLDRLALTEATEANFEPIVLVYDGSGRASEVVHRQVSAPALLSIVGADGVTHRIWPVTDPQMLRDVAADLAEHTAVIADGHHRYASYLRHQQRRHADGGGAGPWDRGLAYLVATGAHGPQVQAIHRLLPGLDLDTALQGAARVMRTRRVDITPDGAAGLLAAHPDSAYLLTDGRQWHLLSQPDPAAVGRAVDAGRSAAWRGLDVTIAHHLLIRSVWGVPDDEHGVAFGHDVPSTLSALRRGGVALLLRPTQADSVLRVARAGERMPRKSTLFVPKPRNGLLLRAYADEASEL
ncbi:DUF1015 domain-containing protein [soil metagenome]